MPAKRRTLPNAPLPARTRVPLDAQGDTAGAMQEWHAWMEAAEADPEMLRNLTLYVEYKTKRHDSDSENKNENENENENKG